MALYKGGGVFPGSGGGGGGGDAGFKRGWQYLAKADATYWAAQHQDAQNNWYNKVISSSDNGSQWEVELDNDQYTSNTGGAGYKVSSAIGWGSYWFWDLPDAMAFNKSNKVILKLELNPTTGFSVANKNDMVVLGLADVGASAMWDPARWAAVGGFSNDSLADGAGLIQPDARFGVDAGGSSPTVSVAMTATSGACTTAIIEVTKNSGSIMNVQTSIYRPSPTGGAAKLAFTYSATANRAVGDLKIFLQVGRTGGSNSDTSIIFKPYYMASTEKDELDWGT
jgi:hypothetical protein